MITETNEIVANAVDEVAQRPWFMRGGEQRPWAHDPHAALFPEDAIGDDRLVSILSFITIERRLFQSVNGYFNQYRENCNN